MNISKNSWLIAFLVMLSACANSDYCGVKRMEELEPVVHTIDPYRHDFIALEHLSTREVVYCYTTMEFTAEECAEAFEEKGFVRLTDIPRFVASDSLLDQNTYPTRRWRSNNLIPRW